MTTNTSKSSITDMPRDVTKGNSDEFGIGRYENGLVNFIERTETPITIALQGEWGSGKTSLMNSLREKLCVKSANDGKIGNTNEKFFGIWLNTWEFALMKDSSTALSQIIIKLVADISKLTDTATVENVKNILKKVLLGGVKIAVGRVSGDATTVDSLFDDKSASIEELRKELQKLIDDTAQKYNGKQFIFFIDDLDRIDPPVAVELLELLKNIFTLEKCVFILAIDYDVVIKGLKPKYGELTDKNEREFRSFFDKIIQVPFSMPVGNYVINVFLKEKLKIIGYLKDTEDTEDSEKLIAKMAQAVECTLGQNPRSIKRLINSLSLINCIHDGQTENKLDEPIELYVNFVLVCFQIAYPKIYILLAKDPDFTQWDESVAMKHKLEPLKKEDRDNLASMAEWKEEWKQILFRACEKDSYLKQNAQNILTLLNELLLEITANKKAESEDGGIIDDNSGYLREFLKNMIYLSAVTSVEANDKEKQEVKYDVRWLIWYCFEQFKKLYAGKFEEKIGLDIKKTSNHAPITLNRYGWFDLTTYSSKGYIVLQIRHNYTVCPHTEGSVREYFRKIQKEKEYDELRVKYDGVVKACFAKQNVDFAEAQSLEGSMKNFAGKLHFILQYQLVLPSVEDFKKEGAVLPIVEMAKAMYDVHFELDKIKGGE